MNKAISISVSLLAFLSCLIPQCHGGGISEEERLVKFHERNYSWPDAKFKPNDPGWSDLMRKRIAQIAEVDDKLDRWEGFTQLMTPAVLQDNFTEFGFGLGRAPNDLMEALRQGVRDGVAKSPREESNTEIIPGPHRPWFVDRPDLTKRVLNELQDYAQTWAGLELKPESSYGFRLYRNESRLLVHVDRPRTHIISFILHIDKSEDAEDWPILIEDYQGRTHEVVLTSGDILFYESAKCFHGRPRPFKGSWYSSIFVHYSPKYGHAEHYSNQARVYPIPPNWDEERKLKTQVPLEINREAGSFDEPSCPNGWCATETSIKWSGPGEEGYWIAPTGEKFPFHPTKDSCLDKHAKCSEWKAADDNQCESNKDYMRQNCPKSCELCDEQVLYDASSNQTDVCEQCEPAEAIKV